MEREAYGFLGSSPANPKFEVEVNFSAFFSLTAIQSPAGTRLTNFEIFELSASLRVWYTKFDTPQH